MTEISFQPAVILLCALLQGCTLWHYELGESLSDSAHIVDAGPLTLAQALTELGPPLRISAAPQGYVLGWEHWQIKESSLGLSLGPLGADFLSIDWGSARTSGEFLLLSFNMQHQMVDGSFGVWDSDAGGGAALQPFIGLATVVDVDDLLEQLPQHSWGATALLPIPQAINTASRPDTGQSGIQQRGTPVGAGQQSLEMN